MLIAGIDSGTQSTKGILLDPATGQIIAEARAPHQMIEGLPPGHMEQAPEMWTAAMESVIAECLEAAGPRRGELAAIGISGQQHGAVVLDRAGSVIRPAKLWCDTSTEAECALFNEAFGGPEGLIALAGNPILPGYTAPKLLWLKRHEPEHFRQIATLLLPHDYLVYFLTGEQRMEYGDASGTGLLDIRTRRWCEPLVEFIDPGFAEKLPRLHSSCERAGLLKKELRDAWGLSGEVVVSAGGGDNMMAAIGSGNLSPGKVTVSLGTSGTLFSCADAPVIDPKGEIAAFCDSTDRWLPLLCTMNATVITEATRHLFHWEHADMEAAISSIPPGADGLLCLPYLNGERTPNYPNATGSFHGLTPHNFTPAHFARAAMEGATLALAYGLNRLRALGINPTEVRLTGGGSASPAWQQICSDAFGVPAVCLSGTEAAALGAALQAAALVCPAESLEELASRSVRLDESTRRNPRPDETALYQIMQKEMFDLAASELRPSQKQSPSM